MTSLSVSWEQCQGHGLCAVLLPELIELDQWGFPVVRGQVTAELATRARSAVRGCPALALRISA
jgi:ferredoxin